MARLGFVYVVVILSDLGSIWGLPFVWQLGI
jgi:hypothetical protein